MTTRIEVVGKKVIAGPSAMQIMQSLFDEFNPVCELRKSVTFSTAQNGVLHRLFIDQVVRCPAPAPNQLVLYGWDASCPMKVVYSVKTRQGWICKMSDLDEKWPEEYSKG